MGLDMTPEERAKRLWEDYCITANPALLRVSIASAIREAVDEALERARAHPLTSHRLPPRPNGRKSEPDENERDQIVNQ
jgi:hypothetical protein